MKFIFIAIILTVMLLIAFSFNPAWRPWTIGIAVIFGLLFFVVPGAVLLGMGMRSVWYGLSVTNWPTTSGVVLHTGITEDQAREAGGRNTYIFYSADLKFRYRVNGHDYTTDTVQFGRAVGSGDISAAAILMLRYPEGAKVKVSYNPKDPSLATVKAGVNSDVALYIIWGAVLILFGAFAGVSYFSMDHDLPFSKYAAVLISVLFILFGIVMLAPGLRNLWYANISPNWPVTDGIVVYSEEKAAGVMQYSGTRTQTIGTPLAYQYEVNGTRYFSNVRHFGQFVGSSSRDWADAILQRYTSGKGVPVSYNPADPDIAALEPGINKESYFLPGGGLAFLLCGLAVFIVSRFH
jgi:hypothetical protein